MKTISKEIVDSRLEEFKRKKFSIDKSKQFDEFNLIRDFIFEFGGSLDVENVNEYLQRVMDEITDRYSL